MHPLRPSRIGTFQLSQRPNQRAGNRSRSVCWLESLKGRVIHKVICSYIFKSSVTVERDHTTIVLFVAINKKYPTHAVDGMGSAKTGG